MVRADTRRMIAKLTGVEKRMNDLTAAWRSVQAYTDRLTDQTFRTLAHGGTFRGVSWRWFAPQYTRADGTVIPAEGGVPKVRGRGTVKGKKRPSGTRVTKSSRLMKDRGVMAGRSVRNWRMGRTRLRGRIESDYAAKQQKMRPWWFWESGVDDRYIRETVAAHIMGRGASMMAKRGTLLEALREVAA